MSMSSEKTSGISIVLCGQAGQGIQTVEKLFTRIMKDVGYNFFATKEYMSRVRGGTNSTLLRISSTSVKAFVDKIDIMLPLDKGAIEHLKTRLTSKTLIVGEKETCFADMSSDNSCIDINFSKIAEDVGDKIYSNTVAVGVLLGLLSIDIDQAEKTVESFFTKKDKEVVDKNIAALYKGYELGSQHVKDMDLNYGLGGNDEVAQQMLINGAEAIGLGAIAAGCNFISSYPMSPSTGVLVFLAQKSGDFGIVVEQAEDEISAINMGLGAWYAGARALVSTSGGGFALMSEGISLSGMLETPIVVHLAQRPGPATGLPTRTEQGDLELALYSGHGEFPRVIFAPGTLEEAFTVTQKAFEFADKFQIPAIILTDQYFMDTYYNTPLFDCSKISPENHFIKTSRNYQRFELSDDGISPRGIPGFGDGQVCVDSDEHSTAGYITEDFDVRVRMVDKRLKKYDAMVQSAIPPTLIGPKDYKNLVICWGSTFNIVAESLELLKRDDTAMLHFSQVYPLPPKSGDIINLAGKTIMVESNATGQFAKLLKLHADISVEHKILKYDGLSFAADTLSKKLAGIL